MKKRFATIRRLPDVGMAPNRNPSHGLNPNCGTIKPCAVKCRGKAARLSPVPAARGTRGPRPSPEPAAGNPPAEGR